MKRLLLASAALAGVLAAQDARAASVMDHIAASATVTTICTVSAGALAFGEVSLTDVTNGTATVNVTCTDGGAYTVALDSGLNAVSGQRNLKKGATANVLAYGLFQDSGHSTAWTDSGLGLVSGTGNASAQPLTVYGQITSGQHLVSGSGSASYTDSVQVTVAY